MADELFFSESAPAQPIVFVLHSLRGMVVIKGRRPDVGSVEAEDTDDDSDDDMGASSSHMQSSGYSADTKVSSQRRGLPIHSFDFHAILTFACYKTSVGYTEYISKSKFCSTWDFTSPCATNAFPWNQTERFG